MCLQKFLFKLIIYGLTVAAYPRSGHKKEFSSDVIFPASNEMSESGLYVQVPPKCHNKTFCETAENYPNSLFEHVLANDTKYKKFFKNSSVEEVLQNRIEPKKEFLICPSTSSITFPKAAFNTKHELKFIYNLKGYRQVVAIEVCVKSSKCKFYDKAVQIRTKCKQKWVEKLLLTADKNGRPYVDRYRFPSACVCSYKDASSYPRFSALYDYFKFR